MKPVFRKISTLYKLFGIALISCVLFSCSSEGDRQKQAIDSYNKGVIAIKSENLDLAGFYFRRAVILKPDFQEARLNLANVYFLDGNLNKAREEYIQLISEKVEDPRIYFNLGWIYLAQNEQENASMYFERVKKNYPEFTDSDYGLAMLAQKKGEDSVTKFYLEKYLEREPKGRWSEKATAALTSLSDVTPEPDTENETVVIDESIPEITKEPVIEGPKEPSKPEKEIIKKPEEKPVAPKKETAEPVKKPETKKPETVAKKETPNPKTLIDEGFNAMEKNDLKTAEKKFKEALTIESDSIDATRGLAKIYFMKKEPSEENEQVKKMVRLDGSNPEDSFELAKGYEKIGDIKSAMEHYRQYLASNPFGLKAGEAKKRLTELDKNL